jgi:hypothetical protein
LVDLVNDTLRGNFRPEDGMLHPSGDLIGSLRHTQLRIAGAPRKPEGLVSAVRLQTGTMWHSWFGDMLESKGLPVMREVRMDRGLPAGWSGTADFLWWSAEYNAFVLADLKTIKGEGIQYIERDGAKEEHIWQLSAYYWAAVNMGLPMVDRVQVIYLPMNEVYKDPVSPTIQEVVPLQEDYVRMVMTNRKEAVDRYLVSFEMNRVRMMPEMPPGYPDVFLTDALAPPMERVQKLMKAKEKWDVVMVPHWSAMFCPFDPYLCPCSTLGTTKVGHWEDAGLGEWVYVPREGFDVAPLVAPKGVKL